MRVLLVTSFYPSERDPVGGVFYHTQASALSRRGIKVDVVAPVPWVPRGTAHTPKRREWAATPRYYEWDGVCIWRPRCLRLPRGYLWQAEPRFHEVAIRRARLHRPDVIHSHFAFPAGVTGARLSARWHVPAVLTLHGSDVNVFPCASADTRRLFSEAVKGHARVFAVSRPLCERTEELTGRTPEQAAVGIELGRFEGLPGKAHARAALGLPADRPIILFVGYLTVAKGVPELLVALSLMEAHGTLGVFVGDGPLRGAVGSRARTVAVGVQPNERVPLYMAAADVLALPSHREGTPTVLVEAGAAGLPVVASDVGGIPDLLGEGRGVVVRPGQPAELAEAIGRLLLDPAAARAMAARLRRHVQADFDADQNAGRLVEVYRRLLDRDRHATCRL